MLIGSAEILGLMGMLLVFASFIVKDWKWLYSFNMAGATLLAIYAHLNGDIIFTVVEAGIVVFLAYRLANEIRNRRGGLETRVRSS